MTETYLAISVMAALALVAVLSYYIPPLLPFAKKPWPQKLVTFIIVLCFLYVISVAIVTFMGIE